MKPVKYLSVLVLLMVMAVTSTYGQSLTDILNKHYAAMGGVAKISGVKTQYVEGVTLAQGQEIPFKKWGQNNKAMRLQFEVMGTSNVQVLNQKSGWIWMPVMGQLSPEDMDSATFNAMKGMLDISGSELYDYAAKGKQVALVGKDTVEGKPAYKLKVTTKEGNVGYVFLDAGSYYIVRALNSVKIQGKEQELISEFADYSKNSEGYVYPATSTQGGGMMTLKINKMTVNQPVADSLFIKPKQQQQ
ncbi:hypothetical protein SAMN05444266_107140 [Chitinophaga jiangningensis]|uniref:Outer membrane lipoprotein-sorting protein n=1 Tax=Chitinophaga jiangningensis TaxID=1419482 RepID=A0A1M7H9V7_9BACT|nr:outer membrane lipoprotein-sorting protein [Chitinophaga jiangningensis]SHM25216.1 hypothetical protein SAMN05444266_107140 [Chitinophaga jiangningensis]